MSAGQFILLMILTIGLMALPEDVLTSECPIQCHCVPNRMSCEIPGLRRLPAPYMSQLESLLVENQTLDSTHLGPSELSMYKTPEFGGHVRLKSLYIRWCNIRTIGRRAFEALGSKLEILDLSGNPLKHIGDYAFAGLGPLTLILDRIDQPKFDDHTFAGLTKMKSLLMRHSKLVSLPYEPLASLVDEKRLDKLLLKGNNFRSLDSKYDRIFSKLQDFEINENPWHCDCQLTWLIRSYRLMLYNRAQVHMLRRRRWGDSNLISQWEQEDNQPKCNSPPGLYGQNFSDLITDIYTIQERQPIFPGYRGPPTIIHCPPPQLERLDIDLERYFISNRIKSSSSVTNDATSSAVNLKCVMRGSKQLTIEWRYHDLLTGSRLISETNATSSKSTDEAKFREWHRRLEDFARTESSVRIFPLTHSDTYSCLGHDILGNVSAQIRIVWPPPTPNEPAIPGFSSTVSPINTTPPHINIHWSSEDIMYTNSALHTAQFSLSQLLGAIGGTFFATVLLFFIIHRCLHYYPIFCGGHKGGTKRRSKSRNLGPVIISSAGTSSSNTSTSNTKLGSSPKADEPYSSMPLFVSSDAMSVSANMLNAHAYHHFMNGGKPVMHGTVGKVYNPVVLPLESQAFRTSLQHGSNGHSTSASYEPVGYSDANNITYDVPSVMNGGDTNLLRSYPEQHLPLLFNNFLTNSRVDIMKLQNSGLIQSALMIPPPPSMPQPSLPLTSDTITLNTTLSRTPSTITNLLVLQANCNVAQPALTKLSHHDTVSATTRFTNLPS